MTRYELPAECSPDQETGDVQLPVSKPLQEVVETGEVRFVIEKEVDGSPVPRVFRRLPDGDWKEMYFAYGTRSWDDIRELPGRVVRTFSLDEAKVKMEEEKVLVGEGEKSAASLASQLASRVAALEAELAETCSRHREHLDNIRQLDERRMKEIHMLSRSLTEEMSANKSLIENYRRTTNVTAGTERIMAAVARWYTAQKSETQRSVAALDLIHTYDYWARGSSLRRVWWPGSPQPADISRVIKANRAIARLCEEDGLWREVSVSKGQTWQDLLSTDGPVTEFFFD